MTRILVVDDEPDLRENLEIALEESGFEISSAGNGAEALQKIRTEKYDLIVCDIAMPKLTGLEVLDSVRSDHPDLAELPFILLSAYSDRDDVIKGRDLGADDYLTKPVDYDLLKSVVASRLSRSQEARSLKEKQFVKLFKSLGGADKSRETLPAHLEDTLKFLAGLEGRNLKGKVFLLFLGDYVRDYPDLQETARFKVQQAAETILHSRTAFPGKATRLGDDTWLINLDVASAEEAETEFYKLAERLAHVFKSGGGTDGHAKPGDGTANDEGALDPETRRKIEKMFEAVSDAPRSDTDVEKIELALKRQIKFRYEPFWSREEELIAGAVLIPQRVRANHIFGGFKVLVGGVEDPTICHLQSMIIDEAVTRIMDIRPSFVHQRQPKLIIPFAVPSMSHEHSYKVESALRDLSSLLENEEVGFLLTGFNGDQNTTYLGKLAAELRAFSSLIMLDVFNHPDFSKVLEAVEPDIVHMELDTPQIFGLSEVDALRFIATNASSFEKRGIRTYISNVRTTNEARAFLSAKSHFLSGRIVSEMRSELPAATPINQAQIMMVA